jgi:hypothetical protein
LKLKSELFIFFVWSFGNIGNSERYCDDSEP